MEIKHLYLSLEGKKKKKKHTKSLQTNKQQQKK